ncbi:MAG: DUF2240 family protein [Candidatus Poseidoniaceae archaeon]
MTESESEDIRRVLAICFRGVLELDALDIERILSLDMGWLKPDEATTAVQALIKAGWLTGAQESLSPIEDFSSSSTPLGWFPRPQRLLNPNPFSRDDSEPIEEVNETPLPTSTEKKSTPVAELKEETNDPRASTTRRLLKYIARASGLETEEVQRRATRKQRALVHVTGWMALALVARDQGLDMDSVIQALS